LLLQPQCSNNFDNFSISINPLKKARICNYYEKCCQRKKYFQCDQEIVAAVLQNLAALWLSPKAFYQKIVRIVYFNSAVAAQWSLSSLGKVLKSHFHVRSTPDSIWLQFTRPD
jgi:hypothetical protein